MIVDKLYESVAQKGVVCVGLDTDISYVPEYLRKEAGSAGEAVFLFNKAIIDATEDVAGCYKVQIAYYESLGLEGMEAYRKTLAYLREKKLISIADIKRGDIAKTAEMYAKGHFEGDFEADFVTLAPYMGMDSVTPYLPYVKEKEKGLFILVRTSNPGSRDFQYLETEKEMPLYDVVGAAVQQAGKEFLGQCGFSSVGAVIGGTTGEEAESIRLRAQEEIRQQKRQAAKDLRREVISIAAAMAKKAAASQMTVAIQDALVEETLREMEEDTWRGC